MCPERGKRAGNGPRLKGSELLEILNRLFIQPLHSPEFGEHGLPFLTSPPTPILLGYMKSMGRKDCSLDLLLCLFIWFNNIFIYYLRILYMFTMCFDHTHLQFSQTSPPNNSIPFLWLLPLFLFILIIFYDLLSPVSFAYIHIGMEPSTVT